MTEVVISDRAGALDVLESISFVPPPTDDPSSTVMRLRSAMARFSGPDRHGPRRSAVAAIIENIELGTARATALEVTARRLGPPEIEAVAQLARTVPTETLLDVLGLPHDDPTTIADVERVVEVIGRGFPPSEEANSATARLLSLAATRGDDPVAVVSMLYQAFDATAALLATTMHASCTGGPAVPAAPRTRRVASRSTTVAGQPVPAGTLVTVEIGAAGLPFGAGPHRCPAEALATQIVAGMVAAISDGGYVVDQQSIATDVDGRPTRILLRRVGSEAQPAS